MPEDFPFYSDSLLENTIPFNDVETSSSIPMDFTTQAADTSDSTSLQPLETSWLTDSSGPPPDVTQLFADSSSTPLETFPFAESSGALLESSCGATEDNLQPYSKRENGDICSPDAESDALPLQNLPDPNFLEKLLGSGQEGLPGLERFFIPRTSGFTVDDDQLCPKPFRRLCCQGPLVTSTFQGQVVGNCRGID